MVAGACRRCVWALGGRGACVGVLTLSLVHPWAQFGARKQVKKASLGEESTMYYNEEVSVRGWAAGLGGCLQLGQGTQATLRAPPVRSSSAGWSVERRQKQLLRRQLPRHRPR